MAVVTFLLIFVEVVCCLLLIVIVLLQKSKGQGLGLAFGSEMGESLFGARATNILVRGTIWLGVIFLVNSLVLAKIYTRSGDRGGYQSQALKIIDTPSPALPPQAAPAGQPGGLPAAPMEPAPAMPVSPMSPETMVPAPIAPLEAAAPAPAVSTEVPAPAPAATVPAATAATPTAPADP